MRKIKYVVAIGVVLLIIGWCMSVYKLLQSDFESPYREEVIRTIGIFVPVVGGIIGFIDIDKEIE